MDNRTTRSETAAATETAPNLKKPGFPLKWVIAGIVAFLVIGGTAAFALFANKSPKQLYLLSEIKTLEKAGEELEDQNGELADFQEKMTEQPSSTKAEITGGFGTDAYLPPELEMMQELLAGLSITTETEQDPKANKSFTKAGVELEGEELLNLELHQSPVQLAAAVPALYDKPFYLNTDEYGQFMRKTDPSYSGPEKLNLEPLSMKDFELSEKEETHLKETYGDFLYKELKDEYFTKKDNVSYEHNGEDLNVTQVTMKLSEKETKALLDNLFERMIKDEKLHSIVSSRVTKLANYNVNQMDMIGAAETKEDFVEGLEDARKELKGAELPKGFTSVILINGDEQVIDRKMDLTVTGDGSEVPISIHTVDVAYDNGNKRDQELKVNASSEGEKVEFLLTNNSVKKDDENRKENLKAEIRTGTEQESLTFTMESDIKGKTAAKQTADRSFTLKSDGEMNPVSLTGKLVQEQNVDAEDQTSKQVFDLELNGGDEMGNINVSLKADLESKLKEKADLPELDVQDAVNVNEVTPEDMDMISKDITLNIQRLFLDLGLF
ncbi:hypothetical protein GKZ89_14810 [Bacillus mangrovi]|uniref:Uncharacterized protein n=1 Tax=Metabacillus mangrovi TaxID=1491830 RepID=A0A7X2S7L0_9BACI|nr:DUF6583 family protein [Metabacillus mangrovi]MTH54671.1 hypothetical protein [Metabacillus mangrovi]